MNLLTSTISSYRPIDRFQRDVYYIWTLKNNFEYNHNSLPPFPTQNNTLTASNTELIMMDIAGFHNQLYL